MPTVAYWIISDDGKWWVNEDRMGRTPRGVSTSSQHRHAPLLMSREDALRVYRFLVPAQHMQRRRLVNGQWRGPRWKLYVPTRAEIDARTAFARENPYWGMCTVVGAGPLFQFRRRRSARVHPPAPVPEIGDRGRRRRGARHGTVGSTKETT